MWFQVVNDHGIGRFLRYEELDQLQVVDLVLFPADTINRYIGF